MVLYVVEDVRKWQSRHRGATPEWTAVVARADPLR